MFIIELNYIVPMEKLDSHMAEHVKYLNKFYKLNKFIVSGRKVPRTGGIIIATANSKEEVDQIIKEDPFYKLNLAEFKVIEFQSSQVNASIRHFLKT